MFRVTESQIVTRVTKLGLKKRVIKNEWTDDMKLFLKQHYKTMARTEIAGIMGVSPECVSQKAWKLGLSKA